MPKAGVIIVRVRLFAANSFIIRLVTTNREPVSGADRTIQIDAVLALKAAGCNIAVSTIWWISVVKVDAAVVIGRSLGSTDGCRIAVGAREEQPPHGE